MSVRDETLNAADINGPVYAAAGTARLAIALRRADMGADAAQTVVFPDDFRGALEVAKTNASDEARRVRARRTGF